MGTLGDLLMGICLPGSLVTGCFNPACSDIDIIVLNGRSMTATEKLSLAKHLPAHSTHPSPIEISFLRMSDIHPWKYPTPFDFHFSEMHRERIEKDLATGPWKNWSDEGQLDSDQAAHI